MLNTKPFGQELVYGIVPLYLVNRFIKLGQSMNSSLCCCDPYSQRLCCDNYSKGLLWNSLKALLWLLWLGS